MQKKERLCFINFCNQNFCIFIMFAGVCTNCRKELVQKMVTASAEMEQEESTKCNVSGYNKEWNSYTKPGYPSNFSFLQNNGTFVSSTIHSKHLVNFVRCLSICPYVCHTVDITAHNFWIKCAWILIFTCALFVTRPFCSYKMEIWCSFLKDNIDHNFYIGSDIGSWYFTCWFLVTISFAGQGKY